MTDNKNQHYVPRCHFRPFSDDRKGKSVNLFNISRNICIENAPVKSQCSRDNFYGQDEGLENAIQLMEQNYARVVKEVHTPNFELSSGCKDVLRKTWLFQHLRTESAIKSSLEMANKSLMTAGIDAVDLSNDVKMAVSVAMSLFVESIDVVDDMKIVLIRNRSDMPFITSDAPAILTNRWFLDRDSGKGLTFGLDSAGDILFLPLSPTVLLCGYDGDTYQIPHLKGWISVSKAASIFALNQHQYLNCSKNVYFSDFKNSSMIVKKYGEIASLRPEDRHSIQFLEFRDSDGMNATYVKSDLGGFDGTKKGVVMSEVIRPKPSAWPKEILYRSGAKCFSNTTGIGLIRRSSVGSYTARGVTEIKRIAMPSHCRDYRKPLS